MLTLGTAVVGLAGITATYLAATKARIAQSNNLLLAISAENDRVRLTDKRHIYAGYMGAIGSYVAAERRLAAARNKDFGNERVSALRSELNQAMTVMLSTLGEIRLIAPENLAILAVNVVQKLTQGEDTSSIFPEFREELYKVMRADLGEPEHQRIEVPEIVSHALER
jgi:hypothetical protein